MQSKISLFNKEIIKQNLRNVGWIGIIYFIGTFFTFPLNMLMIKTSEYPNYVYYQERTPFQINMEFQWFIMMIIPVLLAIFLYRYLQVKQSSDFIHSLPIKRSTLFHHQGLFGIVMLIIPTILNALLMLFIDASIGERYFSLGEIAAWCGITILITLVLFVSAIFVGMFTGLSVAQGVLTYIMLLLPVGLSALLVYTIRLYVYGFPADYYMQRNIEELSIITSSIELNHHVFGVKTVLLYIALAIILYFAGLLVYKKRKLESATQAIAFKQLRPIFKYGVTFCFMLFGGMYFGETQDTKEWLTFGYITGSLFGYIIAEIVLQKNWRVFGKWKGYVAYIIVIGVLFTLIQVDLLGYERKLPNISEVKRVHFSTSAHGYYYDRPQQGMFETEENIQHIYQFHQKLVEEKEALLPLVFKYNRAVFTYELENGKKFVRHYPIPEEIDSFSEYLKPIYETKEYKDNYYVLTDVDDEKIDKITFSARRFYSKQLTITDPNEIKELMEILKMDIYDESYEEMTDGLEPWSEIELLMEDDERIHSSFRKSFERTEQWLKEKGYLDEARITADDVTYIMVLKNNHDKGAIMRTVPYEELEKKLAAGEGLRIKESEQIEEVLRVASHSQASPYALAIYVENQKHYDILGFPEGKVPAFVEQYFNE